MKHHRQRENRKLIVYTALSAILNPFLKTVKVRLAELLQNVYKTKANYCDFYLVSLINEYSLKSKLSGKFYDSNQK